MQLHNNAHCAFAGISHALRLFDLRNAFYCVPLEHHDELYGLCDDFNSVMFQQVLNNPISVIPCADGHVCLLPERGVPPGLTAGLTAPLLRNSNMTRAHSSKS